MKTDGTCPRARRDMTLLTVMALHCCKRCGACDNFYSLLAVQQFALLTCYYFTNNLLIINKLYIFPALHTGRLMPIAELHLVQAVDHTNRTGKCWQINPNEVELVTHVVRPTCWQHWPQNRNYTSNRSCTLSVQLERGTSLTVGMFLVRSGCT